MHEQFMRLAIKLAKKAQGKVAPNPLVGAVVVDKNGKIAGLGFHEKFGEAHAEVNALNQAGEKAKDGTLYVTLEPCAHQGQTPPCAPFVIKSGIKKLVIGTSEVHSCAKGGAKMCEEAGLEVINGILQNECRKLNEIFFKNIEKNKPFVAIKIATTLDGKIATDTGSSKWITSKASREEVQRLRNKYDAILTSSKTVLIDNPSLTCRKPYGRNPVRVLIDRKKRISKNAKIFNNDGAKIYVYSDFTSLKEIFDDLYKKGITSVLVEAGEGLVSSLIQEKIPDKIYQFIAPKILGCGKPFISGLNIHNINDCIKLYDTSSAIFDNDILIKGYFAFE